MTNTKMTRENVAAEIRCILTLPISAASMLAVDVLDAVTEELARPPVPFTLGQINPEPIYCASGCGEIFVGPGAWREADKHQCEYRP